MKISITTLVAIIATFFSNAQGLETRFSYGFPTSLCPYGLNKYQAVTFEVVNSTTEDIDSIVFPTSLSTNSTAPSTAILNIFFRDSIGRFIASTKVPGFAQTDMPYGVIKKNSISTYTIFVSLDTGNIGKFFELQIDSISGIGMSSGKVYKTKKQILSPTITIVDCRINLSVQKDTSSKKVFCKGDLSQKDILPITLISITGGWTFHLTKMYISTTGLVGSSTIHGLTGGPATITTDSIPGILRIQNIYLNSGGSQKKFLLSAYFDKCLPGNMFKIRIDSVELINSYNLIQVIKVNIESDTIIIDNCWNTGIDDDYSDKKQLAIYPNPTTKELHIQTSSTEEIRIYNSLGQKIWEGLDHNIDISYLPTGFYILIMGGETKQFIKL